MSGTVAGTQQIRLDIGHALFGARVEFGDPLFLTISPSTRHSGFAARVSRYRYLDPAVLHNTDPRFVGGRWHERNRPQIVPDGDDMILEMPDYDVRRALIAKDPWAAMQNFAHCVKFLLPRLLGCNMCPYCPHCTDCAMPSCRNSFGHSMTPTGGTMGMCVAFGGSVEYQMNDSPHLHANAYLATMYQYLSLVEVAQLMQDNLVQFADVVKWREWTCCEDYHDLAALEAALPSLEKCWANHNKDDAADSLCYLPAYLWDAKATSLWRASGACTDVEEIIAIHEDAKKFKQAYLEDADFVFSRVHHHWHALNAKTKEREPLRACRSKKGTGCKHKFPMTKRLNLVPKVICKGNCRKHDLRVSGRRNDLGTILGRRREVWKSGTNRAFAVVFRSNTHTAPNYRVPLLAATHDTKCKADCLEKYSAKKVIAAAQRAQRNTTGYYTGYIHKIQRVGKFALRQAARGLKSLSQSIAHRSHPQQFHHVANRIFGALVKLF